MSGHGKGGRGNPGRRSVGVAAARQAPQPTPLPAPDPGGRRLTLSERMARIRKTDTKPELIVRRIAHALGYRFRLHRRDLPGTPDLTFPRLRKVILVHGCFWHRHDCTASFRPASLDIGSSSSRATPTATGRFRHSSRRLAGTTSSSGWHPVPAVAYLTRAHSTQVAQAAVRDRRRAGPAGPLHARASVLGGGPAALTCHGSRALSDHVRAPQRTRQKLADPSPPQALQ
jgi:DNA mismatch endonuclease Vsr